VIGNGIRIDGDLAILGEPSVVTGANAAGVFRHTTLAAWTRLDWPGGTCDVGQTPAYWGERYAASLVGKEGLAVIDGRPPHHHALIELALPDPTSLAAHDGWLQIGIAHGTLSVPFSSLQNLEPGPVEIVVQIRYPRRDTDARLAAKVGWIYGNGDALVHVRRGRIFLDARTYGLEKGAPFDLCDELWPGTFAALEVAGQPRRIVTPIEQERVYRGTIIRALPPHPLHHSIQPPALRIDRVIPLLERLADEPDDDASRSVLCDVLQEEGAPYAGGIAEARAAKRFEHSALGSLIGPLAAIFERVQYRGGLPWSAALRAQMPMDEALLALVGGDVRLGLLTHLVRNNASIASYARVIAMPLAIGLRSLDSCTRRILETLIAAKRDRITSLAGVQLGKSSVRQLLADPTFDRVVDVAATISPTALGEVLAAVAGDRFFERAPRRLAILNEHGQQLAELAPFLAAWSDLPVLGLRAPWCELERRGDATHVRILRGAPKEIVPLVHRSLPDATIESI
jgi:hypothetical protein